MTYMIERVAKALYERNFDGKRAEPSIEPQWSIYTADARAAIAAMREPTGVMRAQGQWAISENLTVNVCLQNNTDAAKIYTAMCDAALGEK